MNALIKRGNRKTSCRQPVALMVAAMVLFGAPGVAQAIDSGMPSLLDGYAKPSNPPEKDPSSVEDAVARLTAKLSEKEVKVLCEIKEDELIRYHMTLGAYIRNSFGLWGRNKDLLRSACGEKYCHPDDASTVIIQHLWKSLQEHSCNK
ncbi:MAG: hypothetical protein FWD68_00965 [Alphaproteobacteria bacterium]|nr:hypothetical protein [Alphaproteobacteria bacterium]